MTLTQTYPTDLTIIEWPQLMDFFPTAHLRGRPRKWATWLILNAILYVTRTGCQWRMLPRDFPPWQTQPSAAIIDSQSVKTSEGGEARGVDVHKQTTGRKRHIVVDVLGLLLTVVVHSAGLPDGTGGKLTLQRLFARVKRNVHNRWCRLKLIWADGAYEAIIPYVRKQFGWTVEVVRRPPDAKGFTVLPRRWVVERSFGWFGRYRRLCRDFEHTTVSSEAMVYLASIRRTLRLVTTEKSN